MSDLDPGALPPSPPDPPLASPPVPVAAPWQERLEVIALLLLLSAAITVVARLAGAYDQLRDVNPFTNEPTDLVRVVQLAGQQIGPLAAGSVLIAFLLVTLGPGDRISQRGVLALRAATVVGLVVAGLTAFAAIASLLDANGVSNGLVQVSATARDGINRVSTALSLLVATAIAGYVAWCAFSTLGEVPPEPVAPTDGPWAPPPEI